MTTTTDVTINDSADEAAVLKPISLDHCDINTGEYGDDTAGDVTLCHYIDVKLANERLNDLAPLRLAGALIEGFARANPDATRRFMTGLEAALDQIMG